jgi:Tol biopolymer transport system component
LRETFKSLSIFSAMLMLLLMISTGCDVNIPGCGKRSLPFFKQASNPATTISQTVAPTNNQTAPAVASVPAALKPSTTVATTAAIPKPTNAPIQTSPTPVPVDVEKFAYTTIENGKPTLWTMNTNGTERTRLTPIGTSSWHPLWSPNGKTLVFLSDMNEGKVNLYMVQKGSKDIVQLTSWNDMGTPDVGGLLSIFSWSPKSDEVAYAYKNQVWLIQLDTLVQTTLVTTDPAYSIATVQWAPHRENKFIAYTVKKGVNYYSIMLVNPRLKDDLTLVESIKTVPVITWASDASKVAYIYGTKGIYSTTVEDTTPKDIFNNSSVNLGPLLAYTPAESSFRLMVLASKTSKDHGYRVAISEPTAKSSKEAPVLKYLTDADIDWAVWSPDGTKIAYVTNGELWITDSNSGASKNRIALTGIQSPDWSRK